MSPGSGYVCPTACDGDCEALCHEVHQPDFKRMHPVKYCEANVHRGRGPFPEGWFPTGCPCYKCDSPTWPTIAEWMQFDEKTMAKLTDAQREERVRVRMSLCPICGYKRCPGAADHENQCSGSNQPGQPGSLYAEAETE